MNARITIRKQKIKVSTTDESLALHIDKQLNESIQPGLTAIMEKVFEQHISPDIYVNIDKLKVDLGTISAPDFEQHFIKLVEPRLIQELQKELHNQESVATSKQTNDDVSEGELIANQLSGPTSAGQQELQALLYFLQYGIYPWWYQKSGLQTPAQLLDNLNDSEVEKLLRVVLAFKKTGKHTVIVNSIDRLIIHLPGARAKLFTQRLLFLHQTNALAGSIKSIITNKEFFTQLFSVSSEDFYKKVFEFLITGNEDDGANTIAAFVTQLQKHQGISVEELQNRLTRIASGKSEQDTGFSKLVENLEKQFYQLRKKEGSQQQNEIEIPDPDKSVSKNQTPSQKISITEQETEGIYIDNAGLLLLHPFLQSFFKEAGLLNHANQFISAQAQHKAAVLLYYLQCGSVEYKEWEMAFNKIICSILLHEVIPPDIVITQPEKAEADTLLQTVINYWEALKGSSIEALQNTFLLRPGKITRKEDFWLIQVERTGVDILLEHLPWGYGTIKFPWLTNLIYTEW